MYVSAIGYDMEGNVLFDESINDYNMKALKSVGNFLRVLKIEHPSTYEINISVAFPDPQEIIIKQKMEEIISAFSSYPEIREIVNILYDELDINLSSAKDM